MEGFNYNEYKNRTRGVESGGNDRAKNPNSSASGRFQFTKDTWKRYGYNWKDRFNPQLQEEAMKRFTEDNINYFKNTFKKEPSYADAYGMHFLGAGGYRKVYTAPDNTPIQEVVSEGAYSSNKSVFSKYKTVGEFKGWLSSKVGQPTSKYSGQENNETSTYKEVTVPNVTMEGKTAEPFMTLPPSEKAEEAKKQIQEYQQIEDLISQMPIAQEEQVIQEVQPQTDYSYLTNRELFTLR